MSSHKSPMYSEYDFVQLCEVEDLTIAILDTMQKGVVVLDDDFRVRTVDTAFCRLLGVEREDAVGRPLAALEEGHWDTAPLTRALEGLARTGRVRARTGSQGRAPRP